MPVARRTRVFSIGYLRSEVKVKVNPEAWCGSASCGSCIWSCLSGIVFIHHFTLSGDVSRTRRMLEGEEHGASPCQGFADSLEE